MKRKKNVLIKELLVEIKKSFPRFLSILIMVFLGTAFYSGISATGPDMQRSADAFYDEYGLMDIRVFGDLGLTEDDVAKIQEIEGIEVAQGRYTSDVFWSVEGESRPVKLMSYSKNMDFPILKEGRLPESTGECLLDEGLAENYGCKIGDEIKIASGTEDELSDLISCDTYKIVGIGDTAYYLSHERGTTTIGNGELKGFMAVPEDDFTLEVFTEITATVSGTKDLLCYEEEYENKIEKIVDDIEAIADERCQIRYKDIKTKAEEKIADGEREIEDAEEELADAEKKLVDAREELENGKKEIKKNEDKIADSEKEMKKAEKQLKDGKKEIKDGKKELENGKKEIGKNKKEIENGKKEINSAKVQLSESKKGLDSAKEELTKMESALPYLPQDQQIYVKGQLEEGRKQYEEGLKQYEEGVKQIEKNEKELSKAEKQIEKAEKEIAKKEKEFKKAEKELTKAEKELKEGKDELKEGKKKLADAKEDLKEGEKELLEAEEEFEEKSAEAKVEIADAKKDLKEAREEIADLEMPEWYVLDRGSVQTFVEYDQDAQRIASLGKVVPILFFLVAALVCLTTMTRMIGEDRTQIGVLKALGYKRSQISMKYMVYALSSTFIGTVLGVIFGQKALPFIIMSAYGILYENLPAFLLPIHRSYTIISFIIAVGCILAAAYSACNKSLKEVPANLMRPVAPKAGKKIFIEKIPFLWKHLNFSQKAAIRNLVRYKKRLAMTVFGIGGCMSLLITGFGIEDSIMSIGDLQYGQIQLYDGSILIDEDAAREEKDKLVQYVEKDERINEYVFVREAAVDVSAKEGEESAVFLVPENTDIFETFVSLTERKSGVRHELKDEGVIISEKLAALLLVEAGDTIILKEGKGKSYEVTISAVVQNYFNHYVYMSPALYEKIHGEKPEYQSIYMVQTERDMELEAQVREDYMELSMVSGISFISDSNETISTMLTSMDTLIYVIVLAAGLLAFVVLYNLNNINIGERKRELATLKVLGFYDGEVSAYIFRENVIITFLGMIAGIGLGILLHRFIILTVETDILMFGREISLMSYIYSLGLTLVFSLLVNGFMHFKMKKIDMIESLKSVE